MSSVEQPLKRPDPAALQDLRWVGKSIPRKEDPKLLTGAFLGDRHACTPAVSGVASTPAPRISAAACCTARTMFW